MQCGEAGWLTYLSLLARSAESLRVQSEGRALSGRVAGRICRVALEAAEQRHSNDAALQSPALEIDIYATQQSTTRGESVPVGAD